MLEITRVQKKALHYNEFLSKMTTLDSGLPTVP